MVVIVVVVVRSKAEKDARIDEVKHDVEEKLVAAQQAIAEMVAEIERLRRQQPTAREGTTSTSGQFALVILKTTTNQTNQTTKNKQQKNKKTKKKKHKKNSTNKGLLHNHIALVVIVV